MKAKQKLVTWKERAIFAVLATIVTFEVVRFSAETEEKVEPLVYVCITDTECEAESGESLDLSPVAGK